MPESVAYFSRAFRGDSKYRVSNWVIEGFSGDKTCGNNHFVIFLRTAPLKIGQVYLPVDDPFRGKLGEQPHP